MKRRLRLFFLCSFLLQMAAAGGIKDVFEQMPDSVLCLLTHNNRLDLIDFAESNMEAKVKNSLGGMARLRKLRQKWIDLEPTEATRLQLALLPVAGSDSAQIVCLVRTWVIPQVESEILFYTTDWHPLDGAKYVRMPQWRDFLMLPQNQTEADRARVLQQADAAVMAARLEENGELRFSLSLDGGFTDVREELRPFLCSELVYQWDGRTFRPIGD